MSEDLASNTAHIQVAHFPCLLPESTSSLTPTNSDGALPQSANFAYQALEREQLARYPRATVPKYLVQLP
jgi:hypothetical protein